ncbi:MAG TPA: hypothetical protein GX701_07655 [Clostridiales bacterium]|jgi:hypothetical protein|nr:hypothetical protein [Clostridiales bacterium]
MELARLKTVVLALLLCINLLLAGHLLLTQYLRYHIPAWAKDEITELLQNKGIALSDRALPHFDRKIDSVVYPGDEEKRKAIATALLGSDAKCTEQGGGIIVYENEKGYAEFGRGGRLQITLQSDGNVPAEEAVPSSSAETEQAAIGLLRSAGISVPKGAKVFGRQGDGVFVRFQHTVRRLDVKNAALEVHFLPNKTIISGTLLTGRAQPSPTRMRGYVSLLADFAAISKQYSLEVKEITRISYVYYHTVDEEGRPLLIPACLIETNNRILVLNAGDGSLLESN